MRLRNIFAGILIGTLMFGVTGCLPEKEDVTGSAVSSQITSQKKIRTFDGSSEVRTSDGRRWNPPAGSHQDKDGRVYDKDGAVIGQVGPVRLDPNAVG